MSRKESSDTHYVIPSLCFLWKPLNNFQPGRNLKIKQWTFKQVVTRSEPRPGSEPVCVALFCWVIESFPPLLSLTLGYFPERKHIKQRTRKVIDIIHVWLWLFYAVWTNCSVFQFVPGSQICRLPFYCKYTAIYKYIVNTVNILKWQDNLKLPLKYYWLCCRKVPCEFFSTWDSFL